MTKRVMQALAATAGRFGISFGTGAAVRSAPDAAPCADYRSSQVAPVVWRDYAARVQSRFGEWLIFDDETVREVNRLLDGRATAQAGALVFVAKVWITATGRISRLEFDGLDAAAAISLRIILRRGYLNAPPPDMSQPLHLKLSLGRPS